MSVTGENHPSTNGRTGRPTKAAGMVVAPGAAAVTPAETAETVAAATGASDQLAAAPRPVFRPGDRVLAIVLLVVTFFLALQMGGIATHATGISAIGDVWLLWPLLTAAMLLIVWGARYAERLARRLLPGLRLGLILAVLAFATFAMIKLHSNEQRCVDKNTMTVVAAANCQHQASQGTTGTQDSYAWYYRGRGTQVGDRVQDGSFTRPDEGSGGNGDTGGDGGDGSE